MGSIENVDRRVSEVEDRLAEIHIIITIDARKAFGKI